MDDLRMMTRFVRIAGAAALCVGLLAGCSTVTGLSDVGGPTPGFHLAQIGSGPDVGDRTIRTARVQSPPPNAYEWTVTAVDPASDRLRIHYLDGACVNADRLAVEETAATVVIGITASKTFQGSCVALGIPRATTVVLRKPLGGRALMEGATGVNDGLTKVANPDLLPSPICSTGYGTASDVPVGMPDAASRIAPVAVAKAFVCRTWWPRGRSRTESTTITDHAELAALIGAIDAGSRDVRPGAPVPRCRTKDSSASWYAVTLEGTGVRVEVRTDAISCDTITNGAASGTMTPALDRRLDALFPA